jgi:hypothetical protein
VSIGLSSAKSRSPVRIKSLNRAQFGMKNVSTIEFTSMPVIDLRNLSVDEIEQDNLDREPESARHQRDQKIAAERRFANQGVSKKRAEDSTVEMKRRKAQETHSVVLIATDDPD